MYDEKAEKYQTKGLRFRFRVGVVTTILLFVSLAGTIMADWTGPDYQFRLHVRSHFENAYYAADPETMKSEIILAKDGMGELGLGPELNGGFWAWEKTPDNSMAWQYKHIDSVLIRIEEFVNWSNSQNGTGSQQMQDVYTSKLNNVRHFIKDDGGWSDDVAKNSYYTNYCPQYTVYFPILQWAWVVVACFYWGLFYYWYTSVSYWMDRYLAKQRKLKKAKEYMTKEEE